MMEERKWGIDWDISADHNDVPGNLSMHVKNGKGGPQKNIYKSCTIG